MIDTVSPPAYTAPMTLLERNPATDACLLHWWLTLGSDGDLVPMFGPWAESAASFLAEFTRPDLRFWYIMEDNRWIACEWSTPFMGGATFNFWIAPDHRHDLERHASLHARMYAQCLAIAQSSPVTIFVTRSEKVVRISHHFGFTDCGAIPYLFHGDTAYVGYMTAADAEYYAQPPEAHYGQ
jgi:hypothetical protein